MLTLILLAMGLVLVPLGINLDPAEQPPVSAAPRDSVRTPAPVKPAPLAPQVQSVLDVLCEFRFSARTACAAEALRKDFRWHAVIATVPDPFASGIPIMFDQAMESLQRAAPESDFTFDRAWLPWREALEQSKGKDEPPAEALRLSQETPGVLVFRAPSRAEGLAVLLVGETPTSGIRKRAFERALRLSEQLTGTAKYRVIGPAFSGSVPSIRQVLEAPGLPKGADIEFISGSATSASNKKNLEAPLANGQIRYYSLLETDEIALRALTDFASSQLEIKRESIAILAEAGTAFGKSFRAAGEQGDSLVLEFPTQISHLRSAYEEDTELRQQWTNRAQGERRDRLEVRFKASAGDRIPAFAPAQFAFQEESMMLDIADTLKREQIRLAVITASDALDIVFLCQLLRRHIPDLQLAVLDADLLYVHAPNATLAGLWMVTNYPLWEENQDWERPADAPRRLMPFPSRVAQGYYNAARFHLQQLTQERVIEPGKALESWRKLNVRDLPPNPKDASSLWLMTVGRGDLWPVDLLKGSDQGNLATLAGDKLRDMPLHDLARTGPPIVARHSHPDSGSGHHDWHLDRGASFDLLYLFLATVGSIVLVNYFYYYVLPHAGPPRHLPMPFHVPSSRDWIAVCYSAIGILGAFGCFLPVASIVISNRARLTRGPLLAIFAAALCVGAFLILVNDLRKSVRQAIKPPEGSSRWTWLGAATMTAVVIGLTVLAAMKLCPLTMADQESVAPRTLFFVVRSLWPFNGASPTLPVVLIWFSVAWFGVAHFNRLHAREARHAFMPTLGEGTDAPLSGLPTALDRIRRAVDGSHFNPFEIAAAMFAFASLGFLGALGLFRQFASAEPPAWTEHLRFGIILLSILLATSLARAFRIWAAIERLLTLLHPHRLGAAFGRLPKSLSVQRLWKRGGTHYLMQSEIELLDRLRLYEALENNPLGVELLPSSTIEQKLADALRLTSQGRRPHPEEIRSLQRALNHNGEQFFAALCPRWKQSGAAAADAPARPETPGQRAMEIAEEFVALRLISYIRYAVLQIRYLLEYLVLGVVFLMVGLGAYPLQPQMRLLTAATAFGLVVLAATFYIFARMDRDAVLSLLNKTPGGKLDLEFYTRALVFGLPPLLTMTGAQFPGLTRTLSTWLAPLARMLQG